MATIVEPLTDRPLTERPAWKSLEAHRQKARSLHLRDLFAYDSERGRRFTAEAAGIYLDYSKNPITDETPELLSPLAEEYGLRQRIDAMFHGEKSKRPEKPDLVHL